jgi:mannosyltransferase
VVESTAGERGGWVVLPLVLALTTLGAGLRLYNLDSGLWYDEIKTLIDAVRPPLGQILTSLAGDNDHPLYSVLAHLSIAAFGESAWSLRLPAAIAGIATIPALYLLGTRVAGHFEALAAAALLTLSYHHIWFSQNARGYTLLLLCAVVATHLLLIALRHGRRRTYVWYGIVAALGTYTHLTMVFVIASHAVVWWWGCSPIPRGGRASRHG